MKVRSTNKLVWLITFTLFLGFSLSTWASVGDGKTSSQKLPQSFFDNIVVQGATTAKVFDTDKGATQKWGDPYNPGQYFNVFAGTFDGEVDGQNAKFYCIDLQHNIAFWKDEDGKRHEYTDDGPTPEEITYILNNYYPYISYPYTGALDTENKEASAVQLAIWHFADGVDLSTIENSEIRNRVIEIVADANAKAGTIEPLETLVIIPASQNVPYGSPAQFYVATYDIDGNPLSGITVNLSASTGTLSSSTAITNASGFTGIITLTQGSSDYSEITANANVQVPMGTRYVHKNAPDTYQKLVLATPAGLNRDNYATVQWYEQNGECDLDGFATYTQGGWGSPSNSGPGTIRDLYFDDVFPAGLTVGGNFTLTLTSAQAVEDFLPQGGTPSALTQDYTDPGNPNISVLAGQVVAMTLNVYFSAAGYTGSNSYPLGDLIITSGPLAGKTVYELLAFANTALGGGSTPYSLSELNDAATAVNENFNEGANNGFLTCAEEECENILGDFVWHDKNVNGIQDAGEPGIEGVVIELSFDNTTLTTTTDANGYYQFANLPNGSYEVKVATSNYASGGVLANSDQTKWYATNKNQGDDTKDSDANKNESVTVVLDCGDDYTVDFGFYKTCVTLL
ncbi:MAG: carboxypeptidase regulatory-like domain-containing protein, partial [Melioribacteraceae bacterium]|nr:carboxypeptidase regulatory-like domain-containing protein [Melioribacteraceae bacterium]